MNGRVLVVDDDPALAEMLGIILHNEGLEVTHVADGSLAVQAFRDSKPDVVLLDVHLPDLSGLEVLRRMRDHDESVPVLFLTAKDAVEDRVAGLTAGGDDYVTKPFSLEEVVARIRAVLRRRGEGGDVPVDPVLEAGPVRMDVERHVVAVDGEQVALPLKEFDLLEYLMRNAGRVLTRGQLIDRIWGADYVGDTKTLDVHVKRLRTKIEQEPSRPKQLVTVRGLGYKFEA
mgnify:CR=1 FL=1